MSADSKTVPGVNPSETVILAAMNAMMHAREAEVAMAKVKWTQEPPPLYPANGPAGIPNVLEELLPHGLTPVYCSKIKPFILQWSSVVDRVDQELAAIPKAPAPETAARLESARARLATIEAGPEAFLAKHLALQSATGELDAARQKAARASADLAAWEATDLGVIPDLPWAPPEITSAVRTMKDAIRCADDARMEIDLLVRPTFFGKGKYMARLAELQGSESGAREEANRARAALVTACQRAHAARCEELAAEAAECSNTVRKAEALVAQSRHEAQSQWDQIAAERDSLAGTIKAGEAQDAGKTERRAALEGLRMHLATAGGDLFAIGIIPAQDDTADARERAMGLATCGLLTLMGTSEARSLVRAWAETIPDEFITCLWAVAAQFLTLMQGDIHTEVEHEGRKRFLGDLLSEPVLPLLYSRGFFAAMVEAGDELLPACCACLLITHCLNHYDLTVLGSAFSAIFAGMQIQSRLGRPDVAHQLEEKLRSLSTWVFRGIGADSELQQTILSFAADKAQLADRPEFTFHTDGIGTDSFLQIPGDRRLDPPLVDDETALLAAIDVGQTRVAIALLQPGHINGRLKVQDGATLLHLAARSNLVDLIEVLIARGADVNAEDESGFTPLDAAIAVQSREAAEMLLKSGARGESEGMDLMSAAKTGNAFLVEFLLGRNRGSAALRDDLGFTPLHWAHREGVAQALLAAGADVNARNTNGVTPLLVAASNNYDAAVVKALLDAGAEVDAANEKERLTPLWWAAFKGNTDVVKLLLAAGANESIAYSRASNRSALQAALENGHQETAEVLRSHGQNRE